MFTSGFLLGRGRSEGRNIFTLLVSEVIQLGKPKNSNALSTKLANAT